MGLVHAVYPLRWLTKCSNATARQRYDLSELRLDKIYYNSKFQLNLVAYIGQLKVVKYCSNL